MCFHMSTKLSVTGDLPHSSPGNTGTVPTVSAHSLASTPPGMPGTHPPIFSLGGRQRNILPILLRTFGYSRPIVWLISVRSASSRFHSAIRRHQFASVRQADSRLTRLVPPHNLELALTTPPTFVGRTLCVVVGFLRPRRLRRCVALRCVACGARHLVSGVDRTAQPLQPPVIATALPAVSHIARPPDICPLHGYRHRPASASLPPPG